MLAVRALATVVARTDMEVLVLSPSEFETLLDLSPQVARRMVSAMAERLRKTNEMVEV